MEIPGDQLHHGEAADPRPRASQFRNKALVFRPRMLAPVIAASAISPKLVRFYERDRGVNAHATMKRAH
jgi:hypothetical protein